MEIEEMPKPTDTIIIGRNPRRRDGKDAPYMLPEANMVIFPVHRLMFIEVMPTGQEEEIATFIRE
jgi:hypothetical protein